MTDKTVWFGTQERMSWVPAPIPGVDRSLSKWRTGGQFLNGGQWSKESATGARSVQLTWPTMTSEKVRKIRAYLEGNYGSGPFYYSDPFAENANVCPVWLAAPWLACADGPSLRGKIVRPTKVTTPANAFDYPSYGATYSTLGDGELTVTLPIPENHSAYVGVHGTATGSSVMNVNGSPATLLGVTTSTLTNKTVAGPGWLTFRLGGTGTITLYGVVVQILPTGSSAPTGPFVPGEGHGGLSMSGDPQITGYSSAQNRQAISANFVEVEAWQ